MRLLFLNHNVAWGGGTFFRAWHLARVMARKGHDVALLTIAPRARARLSSTRRDGVLVVETPDLFGGAARSGWDPWDTMRRCAYVATRHWDVVHAFDSRPAVILPALAAQRRGAALVLDWADWWGRGGTIEERQAGASQRWLVRPVETWFEESFRTRAVGTTVISRALESRAIGLGVPEASIVRIPQGSDIEGILPRCRDECRAEMGLDVRGPVFGYLGVLTRSDAELLWATFERIHAQRADARLVLVGRPRVPVPSHPAIVETGFVSHATLVAWLGACDVCLLPLRDTIASRARWPSKANDYLAAGRPVVTTAVGDLAPMIAAAGAGLTTPDNPERLAEAALCLATDPDAVARCGQAARRLAEGPLNWTTLATQLEKVYAAARNGNGLAANS
jgi:glycosyltransferase involved in cell wall biosynthesis